VQRRSNAKRPVERHSVEVRREEILRAAVEEIEERGFASTRVADVADKLNVSSALVFYHFDSRDRLLAEAFAYAAERDLRRLDQAKGKGTTASERLRAVLRIYAPTGAASGWTLWIDAWAAALRSPDLRRVSRRLDTIWKDTIAAIISEGVASGEFSCPDAQAAAWRITALLDGLAIQVTVHRGLLTRRDMTAWVVGQAAAELGVKPSALA
jgi:AcrR family transcriptional regulator